MSVKRLATLVLALGLISALVPATALATAGSWDVNGTYGVDVT